MRSRTMRWAAAGGGIALLVGTLSLASCTDPLGVQRGASLQASTPKDTVANDSSVAQVNPFLDRIAWGCGNWSARPPQDPALLDLLWSNDVGTSPSAAQIAAVRAVGGEIEYRFHIDAVRAYIPTEAVSKLELNAALAVRDSSRHDVGVIVMYASPVTQGDVGWIVAHGGRVTYRYTVINGLAAYLPDAVLPALRKAAGVTSVDADQVMCLA